MLQLNKAYPIEYEQNRQGAKQIIINPLCDLYKYCKFVLEHSKSFRAINDLSKAYTVPFYEYENKILLTTEIAITSKSNSWVIFTCENKTNIKCFPINCVPFNIKHYINEERLKESKEVNPNTIKFIKNIEKIKKTPTKRELKHILVIRNSYQ